VSLKIFKYFLDTSIINKTQIVAMPAGANVLSVGVQRSRLCVWAEIDEKNAEKPIYFYIAFTGCEVPDRSKFIGTCQLGSYVLHIYELKQP